MIFNLSQEKKVPYKNSMNCFNSLVEDNKQVVLVCDRDPAIHQKISMKNLNPEFQVAWLLILRAPDFNDRIIILKEKAELLGQEIADDVTAIILLLNTSKLLSATSRVRLKLIAENYFAKKLPLKMQP